MDGVNWGVFTTQEFLIGVVVIGLLVNIVSAYLVRSVDWVARVLPASFRRVREKESGYIRQLVDAAIADHAIYAALAAEGGRLRARQLFHFFFAFVCISALMLATGLGALRQGSGLSTFFFLMFVVPMAFVQYVLGLRIGQQAQRVDLALLEVQRTLDLPISKE